MAVANVGKGDRKAGIRVYGPTFGGFTLLFFISTHFSVHLFKSFIFRLTKSRVRAYAG